MAVMMLVLNCIPCTDGNASETHDKIAFAAQDTQHENDHEDNCSPFCQCACCFGFSISHDATVSSGITMNSGSEFGCYLPENLLEISRPIWQPPKI